MNPDDNLSPEALIVEADGSKKLVWPERLNPESLVYSDSSPDNVTALASIPKLLEHMEELKQKGHPKKAWEYLMNELRTVQNRYERDSK